MSSDIDRLNLLLSLRRYAEGEKAAREMIAEYPELGTGYTFLALFLLNQDQGEDAIAPARSGVGKSPHDPWAHAILSVVLDRSGERGSYKAAHEAIRLDPAYTYGYSRLAEMHCEDQRFTEAHEAALDGLRYDPEDESLLYWKGWTEFRLQRTADALATAEEGLRLHPQSDRLHNLRGGVLQHLGEQTYFLAIRRSISLLRQAVEAFQEAVRLDPSSQGYQNDLNDCATEYRRRVLSCVWAGVVLVFAIVWCVVYSQSRQPGGICLYIIYVGMCCGAFLMGIITLRILPPWLILSLPLGWLGVNRVPLTVADHKDRRNWLLMVVVATGFFCVMLILALLEKRAGG